MINFQNLKIINRIINSNDCIFNNNTKCSINHILNMFTLCSIPVMLNITNDTLSIDVIGISEPSIFINDNNITVRIYLPDGTMPTKQFKNLRSFNIWLIKYISKKTYIVVKRAVSNIMVVLKN